MFMLLASPNSDGDDLVAQNSTSLQHLSVPLIAIHLSLLDEYLQSSSFYNIPQDTLNINGDFGNLVVPCID